MTDTKLDGLIAAREIAQTYNDNVIYSPSLLRDIGDAIVAAQQSAMNETTLEQAIRYYMGQCQSDSDFDKGWCSCSLNVIALMGRLGEGRTAIAAERKSAEGKEWRCFHCDEVFVTAETAREHFGADEICEPACKIDIAEYRRLEDQQASCRAECCEEAKRYYAMQADYVQALIREEQKGYDKGLADGRALRPSPIPPAKESAQGVSDKDLLDLCFKSFMRAKDEHNDEDGGPVDWTNDTLPRVRDWIAVLRTKPDAGAFAEVELTSQEIFLLEWLGKEDSSAYGECSGLAMNVLINSGLAKTSKTPPSDYDRVSLTDAGIARLRTLAPSTSTASTEGKS